jgi:uncharacterized protein (TIGR03000 family)
MYSMVLATMLTTGQAAPEWFHGCCGGCWGCHGCCGGCWGCCGGCWGCYGCCGGCWGCYGCCGGCWGCSGCWGCWGCCGGCCGGVVVAPAAPVVVQAAPAVVAPAVVEPAKTLPAPTMQKVSVNGATVVVKAPMDVRVTVDGQETKREAVEESFATPSLEPGRTYQYVFKAEAVRDGKPVTVEKKVKVLAGQQSLADFSELDAAAAEVAKVTVRLPAEAKLYVDDVACPLVSSVRTFETPKLEPGRQYYYTIRAEVQREGRTETESRRVVVEAGKLTTVEFKDITGVQAARR